MSACLSKVYSINVGSWAGAKSCGGKNKDFFLRPKFSSILPFWGGQFIASQIIIFSVTEEKCKRREASKPANPRQHCRLPIHEYTRIGRRQCYPASPSSSQLSVNGLPGTGKLRTAPPSFWGWKVPPGLNIQAKQRPEPQMILPGQVPQPTFGSPAGTLSKRYILGITNKSINLENC